MDVGEHIKRFQSTDQTHLDSNSYNLGRQSLQKRMRWLGDSIIYVRLHITILIMLNMDRKLWALRSFSGLFTVSLWHFVKSQSLIPWRFHWCCCNNFFHYWFFIPWSQMRDTSKKEMLSTKRMMVHSSFWCVPGSLPRCWLAVSSAIACLHRHRDKYIGKIDTIAPCTGRVHRTSFVIYDRNLNWNSKLFQAYVWKTETRTK